MISQVSVGARGGGGLPHTPGPEDRHPPGQTTPAKCMLGYTPPAQCMLGYTPQQILWDTVNKQTVHISLESILVTSNYRKTGVNWV